MSDLDLKPAADLYPSHDVDALKAADETGSVEQADASSVSEAVNLAAPPLNTAYRPEIKEALVDAAVLAGNEQEPTLKEVEFSIVSHADPARQADPNGIYLDDIVRRDAEILRARVEGREPDFDNMGTTCGDVVQPTVTVQKHTAPGVVVLPDFTQEIVVGTPNMTEGPLSQRVDGGKKDYLSGVETTPEEVTEEETTEETPVEPQPAPTTNSWS